MANGVSIELGMKHRIREFNREAADTTELEPSIVRPKSCGVDVPPVLPKFVVSYDPGASSRGRLLQTPM